MWGLTSSLTADQSGAGPEAIQYLATSAPCLRMTRSISATTSMPRMPGRAVFNRVSKPRSLSSAALRIITTSSGDLALRSSATMSRGAANFAPRPPTRAWWNGCGMLSMPTTPTCLSPKPLPSRIARVSEAKFPGAPGLRASTATALGSTAATRRTSRSGVTSRARSRM